MLWAFLFIVSFSPHSAVRWLYEHYFTHEEPDVMTIHTTAPWLYGKLQQDCGCQGVLSKQKCCGLDAHLTRLPRMTNEHGRSSEKVTLRGGPLRAARACREGFQGTLGSESPVIPTELLVLSRERWSKSAQGSNHLWHHVALREARTGIFSSVGHFQLGFEESKPSAFSLGWRGDFLTLGCDATRMAND